MADVPPASPPATCRSSTRSRCASGSSSSAGSRSKAREVAHLNVLEAVTLRDEPPLLVLALVEARFPAGTHELYQVPLGLRPADEGWDERVIAEARRLDALRRAGRPAARARRCCT